MVTPLRGEVWWVNLDPTAGSEIAKTRPCVVISDDVLNRKRRTVVIVPISSSARLEPPLTVAIHCRGKAGVAVIDQIRATAKERFQRRLDKLTYAEMAVISDALRVALDLG